MGLTVIQPGQIPEPIERVVPPYVPPEMRAPYVDNYPGRLPSFRWDQVGDRMRDQRPPAPPSPPCLSSAGSIDITVIDQSDRAGQTFARGHDGAVAMARDIREIVTQVIRAASCNRIDRLLLCDHGTSDYLTLGDSHIAISSLNRWQPELARLHGMFSAEGFVLIVSCNVGNADALLREIVRTVGVPVCSATNYGFAGFGGRVLFGGWRWYGVDGQIRSVRRSEVFR